MRLSSLTPIVMGVFLSAAAFRARTQARRLTFGRYPTQGST